MNEKSEKFVEKENRLDTLLRVDNYTPDFDPEKEPILRVEHLKQYFKSTKAVDDVSFTIKKGEVFGLVGESGCGKTTTGRSIIGLYPITDGDVYFRGKRIGMGVDALKRWKAEFAEAKAAGDTARMAQLKEDKVVHSDLMTKIQMIFQDPVGSLDPRMTVREIIAEGLRIRGIRDKQFIDERVAEVLEKVGLVPEHAERYPHEFSGGQRQRIGIARAIVLQPDMIIADEPISALDVSIQAQVINLMNDLRDEMGLTIMFIAHDLSVVKYFSDRIGVMYFGKMVELADSDELFAHPLHPYTRSLLSAIPLPDPNYEKKRKRITYVPALTHDYSEEGPEFKEVIPGHFVYCNTAECEKYRKEVAEMDANAASK
ncbi:MAG: ATP-binding cassette domain-containing protein [Clostridia bacterium]|nr:ATP-binding cassette domain-containing protein [Clostridia bacterium]MBR6007055.1 ATP-binding cassette domain-containing protein [Clostridia bacterium]